MSKAYLTVTIMAAAANFYAAYNDFRRFEMILANMKRLGVSERWLTTLGVLKLLGAIGLLVGIGMPSVGVAAAIGLTLFFIAAILFTLRSGWYAHLIYPAIWLMLAVGSLGLRLAAR
jgi:DoxX-like family